MYSMSFGSLNPMNKGEKYYYIICRPPEHYQTDFYMVGAINEDEAFKKYLKTTFYKPFLNRGKTFKKNSKINDVGDLKIFESYYEEEFIEKFKRYIQDVSIRENYIFSCFPKLPEEVAVALKEVEDKANLIANYRFAGYQKRIANL